MKKNKPLSVKEKKATLDTLIKCGEEYDRIQEAFAKLCKREDRLDDRKNKLAEKMIKDMQLQKENVSTPIVYQNNEFLFYFSEQFDTFRCNIKAIKKM